MANTDQFPASIRIHQWQRPDAPNPRLASPIEATTTTITVTAPFKDGTTGAIITGDFLFGVKNSAGYVETIYAPASSVSVDGLTITGVVRGVRLGGLDYTTGDSSLAVAHEQDSPVYANISALLFQMMIGAMTGSIASGGLSWKIGTGTDNDIKVIAYNADTHKPFFEYNAATNQWVYSNDGVSSTPFGTGAGITGGDGITVTAGDVAIDFTDTNAFVTFTSGVADAGKGVALDGDGLLDVSFLPTNLTVNTIATNMTYGQNLVVADVVGFDGNQKVVKTDADAVNTAFLFAGVAQADGAQDDYLKVAPLGVVSVNPAFTLSDRENCRLWDGQSNTTSNTTSDSLSAITQWRAQTFTPSSGQDNVAGFVLNLTNSVISGVLTCALYATSGGLPSGAPLASITKASADVVTGDNTFSFASAVSVTANTAYAVVFYVSTYTSGSVAWNYQNTDIYAGGQRCTSSNSGTNWTADATSDYRFTVRYRGISGEPVFISNTAGKLSLAPGTYVNKVGYALDPNQVVLTGQKKVIYGTIDTTVVWNTSATTETEVELGFRPSLIVGTILHSGLAAQPLTGNYISTNTYPRFALDFKFTEDGYTSNILVGESGVSSVLYSLLLSNKLTDSDPNAFDGSKTAIKGGGANDDIGLGMTMSVVDGSKIKFTRTINRQVSAGSYSATNIYYRFIAYE